MDSQFLQHGQRVTGQYYGREFIGTIKNVNTTQWVRIYYVELDSQIETSFGPTNAISFSADIRDEKNEWLISRHFIKGYQNETA